MGWEVFKRIFRDSLTQFGFLLFDGQVAFLYRSHQIVQNISEFMLHLKLSVDYLMGLEFTQIELEKRFINAHFLLILTFDLQEPIQESGQLQGLSGTIK